MNDFNVIIAGVGGQGILTIATLIARAAIRTGMQVKQSEVHGMSQRGGAVQAHVRIANSTIHSELIPLGKADLIIAVEPLESLRYLEYLDRERGAIVTSSAPMKNIDDYPPIERVLANVARSARRHAIVDAPAIAREAGSPRAENVAILGAASCFLPLERDELIAAIRQAFAGKGDNVVAINCRAFDLARERAFAAIRPVLPAERTQLFEHEVYDVLAATGRITPPLHRFVGVDQVVTADVIDQFPRDQIVLKVVSPQAVHKSDSGGVRVVERSRVAVDAAMKEMIACHREVAGVLLVEFVPHSAMLGGELFVGLRASREFGPLIVAGLGGLQTEYLASRLQPDRAVAIAPALTTTADEFFQLFTHTAAWELLSGKVRGSEAQVTPERLITCFGAFIDIARQQMVGECGFIDLEVNPFAVADGVLIPLDGRGRIGPLPRAAQPRATRNVRRLLQPRSIAVLGVSAQRSNFGRIILNNTQASGFPPDRLYVIKDGVDQIDGVPCFAALADVPKPVDLLVAAVTANQVPKLVADVTQAGDAIGSVILISGGLGETADTIDAAASLRQTIHDARATNADAPVFVGPNSMGVVSRPGRYDTFFIQPRKRATHRDAPPTRLAIVSQSGAFIISRMSNQRFLVPDICVSLGNQLDVTFADVINAIGERDDIDCIGVYVEGFNDLDGLEFIRAVKRATHAGKTIVFYKAGRTAAGRTAAQGHTASLAGDWNSCCAAVRQAGALVSTCFDEFEQLVELGATLHAKTVTGSRIAAISNAGCETVAMADNIIADEVELPELSDRTKTHLRAALDSHHIGSLVNIRNPLDITPMANDETYEQCIDALLAAPEVDAAIVGCVPMSSQLLTTADEITSPDSLANRIAHLFRRSAKPLLVVLDCAAPFEPLSDRLRSQGVPVFRHVDQAIQSLGKYLAHRSRSRSDSTRCDRSATINQVQVQGVAQLG